jgi:hypothetical protein
MPAVEVRGSDHRILDLTKKPLADRKPNQHHLRGNGGVHSQIRTGLEAEFPDNGRFTGNFRQKLPVLWISP